MAKPKALVPLSDDQLKRLLNLLAIERLGRNSGSPPPAWIGELQTLLEAALLSSN